MSQPPVRPAQRVLPDIDAGRCTTCGLCADYCPTKAVEIGDSGPPAIVRPEDCTYCGTCEDLCPEGAIALVYEVITTRAGG